MTLYYYKTELSGTEIEEVFTSEEAALEAAKKEWEAAGEEYDEDLTWITPVELVGTTEFEDAVSVLKSTFPNDMDLGKQVRALK
jgi:hypothetical protein